MKNTEQSKWAQIQNKIARNLIRGYEQINSVDIESAANYYDECQRKIALGCKILIITGIICFLGILFSFPFIAIYYGKSDMEVVGIPFLIIEISWFVIFLMIGAFMIRKERGVRKDLAPVESVLADFKEARRKIEPPCTGSDDDVECLLLTTESAITNLTQLAREVLFGEELVAFLQDKSQFSSEKAKLTAGRQLLHARNCFKDTFEHRCLFGTTYPEDHYFDKARKTANHPKQ